jgi:hypothetical protein
MSWNSFDGLAGVGGPPAARAGGLGEDDPWYQLSRLDRRFADGQRHPVNPAQRPSEKLPNW